jgi:hypothetical protein
MLVLAAMNLSFMVWVLCYPFETAAFVGLSSLNENAETELRAMYGGLIGGLGVINLLGALTPKRTESAVWASAWTFLGVGVVRSVGCLHFGIYEWQGAFALSELACATTCFIMLKSFSHDKSNQQREFSTYD